MLTIRLGDKYYQIDHDYYNEPRLEYVFLKALRSFNEDYSKLIQQNVQNQQLINKFKSKLSPYQLEEILRED